MKKFGIIGHINRPQVRETTEAIINWCAINDVSCKICKDLIPVVGKNDIAVEKNEIWRHSDVIISLGGDGTMLSAAHAVGMHGIPIFGINLGKLGFLTDQYIGEINTALERLKNGEFQVEERMALQAEISDGGLKDIIILNDLVVDRGDSFNLIQLDLYANNEFVCSYAADGIIVSTPTGSTAYSLSVGGPIIQPSMDAISVSPISPHTLTLRPILFPADYEIRLTRGISVRELRVSIDGQYFGKMKDGQEIRVRRAESKVKLIKIDGGSFFEILRTKLHWGARPLFNT